MVDAGHDVVGVHLALSSAPGTLRTGSRGCCSKEDAGDARRVADVLDIPFYVWDFADRFKEDVIDDFVDVLRPRRDPEPVRAVQREDQVLRAVGPRAGAGLRRRGHRPLRAAVRRPAAARGRRRQGPVLRARRADRRAAAPRAVPDRRHPQAADPRGGRRVAAWPSPTSPTATTSASSRPATPGRSSAPDRRAPRHGRRRRRARCSPSTTACTASPSASARASASRARAPTGGPAM